MVNTGRSKKEASGLIGIFFVVEKDILMEAVPLSEGEKTVISIDHKGSHYDYWESLVPKTAAEKKFKARAYDAYPRGRVLFHLKRSKFIIYRDKCINKDQIRLVKEKFKLKNTDCDLESDAHYKCSECNPLFVD